jgi:hypothetical protein
MKKGVKLESLIETFTFLVTNSNTIKKLSDKSSIDLIKVIEKDESDFKNQI